MGGPGGEEELLAADDHLELTVENVGNLFVGVAVFGQAAVFFDFPDCKGAFVAMHHFPKKTRPDFFGWDVRKILHEQFWSEGTEKWGTRGAKSCRRSCEEWRGTWVLRPMLFYAHDWKLCVLDRCVNDRKREPQQCCGKVDKVCWRGRNKCGNLVQIRI